MIQQLSKLEAIQNARKLIDDGKIETLYDLSGKHIYHKKMYTDDRKAAVKALQNYDIFKAFDEVADYSHKQLDTQAVGASPQEIEYNFCLMIESYRDPVKLATGLAKIRADQVYNAILILTDYRDITDLDDKGVKSRVLGALDYLEAYWSKFGE